jgi:malonyl-CoA decarboxylase
MTDTTLLNRTLRQFRRVIRLTAGIGAAELRDRISADLPESELPAIAKHIDACLEGRGGEVSARARAAELGEIYLTLSAQGRGNFLQLLANNYDVPSDKVTPLIGAWQAADEPERQRQIQNELRHQLIPPRMRLLQQFNELALGVKFLVDMRADLLPLARKDPALRSLSEDLQELLASWFDVGFLDLARITWNTPAALLEKLIAYEAVHAIRSWDDLKDRLGEDRRCYAFFHPRMPDEPLIFVQVALVRGLSGNIQGLLDQGTPEADPREADTAIFYSISNCQSGLAGVSFGNFLIKRVASDLATDLPNIKTFSTLSPIPGFSRWLGEELEQHPADVATGDVPPVLSEAFHGHGWAEVLSAALNRQDWVQDESLCAALEPTLTRACARYLLNAKRGARALDPVAHFHLTNGARVERINWLGDTSKEGMERSAGLMVNYLYELGDVDENHESYSTTGQVTSSGAVGRLLK